MKFAAFSESEFYEDCAVVARSFDIEIIEFRVNKIKMSWRVDMVIAPRPKDDGDSCVGVEDCAKIHRILLQKLAVLLNDEDIYMEVSSPGTDRNIKNAAEFSVFRGKKVRLWLEDAAKWLVGRIGCCDDNSLVLEDEGNGEKIEFSKIKKAKLCG